MSGPLLDVTRRYLEEKNTWEHHDGKEPLWDYVRDVLRVTLNRGRKVPAQQTLRWVEEALHELGESWLSFNGVDSNEDGRSDFYMAYQRAKCPAGKNPLELAWERAQEEPVNFAHEFPSEDYGRFLNLAFRLQESMGDAPIGLPRDLTALLMGKTRKTITNWRKIAIAEGYLSLVEKSVPKKVSALYRFHLEKKNAPGERPKVSPLSNLGNLKNLGGSQHPAF
jgi:hypothetical protein